MNKKLFLILAAMTTLVLSSCTINKPQEQVRTITVSGTGSVSVKPDILTLTFTLKNTDWVITNAVNNNSASTDKVIKAISEAGVDIKDIQTYDYKITQETYMSNGREYPGRYTVSNSLNIIIRNISVAANVIDAAIRNGTNALSGFEYSVSDTTTALRQARTLAVQNAQDAAALLAGASGCKVNQVIDIQEGFVSTAPMRAFNSAGLMDTSIPFAEGNVAVTANVTITYSLME